MPKTTAKTSAVLEGFWPPPLQPVIQPPFSLGMGFALQLLGLHPLQLPRLVLPFHFPALPDGSKTGGDFVVVQPFLCGAQAVGQALRGFPFF